MRLLTAVFGLLACSGCTSAFVKASGQSYGESWFAGTTLSAAEKSRILMDFPQSGRSEILLTGLMSDPRAKGQLGHLIKIQKISGDLFSKNSLYFAGKRKKTTVIPGSVSTGPSVTFERGPAPIIRISDVEFKESRDPVQEIYTDGDINSDPIKYVYSNYKIKYFDPAGQKIQYLGFWSKTFVNRLPEMSDYEELFTLQFHVLEYDQEGFLIAYYEWPPARHNSAQLGSFDNPESDPQKWDIDFRFKVFAAVDELIWSAQRKIVAIESTHYKAATQERYYMEHCIFETEMKANRIYLCLEKFKYQVQ